MKFSIGKEWPYLALIALPIIYLAIVWNGLPDELPMHWNLQGEVDRWGNKSELWILPFLLPGLIYVIMLSVPNIDPKQQLEKMDGKYQQFKFILVLFMSILALYIIYAAQQQSLTAPNALFVLIGLMFAGIGNYFQTIKPNYFLGIKTPWTLENETVWKQTHKMGGIIWMIGGLAIVGISLLFPQTNLFFIGLFLGITILLCLIPVVYSYQLYQKLK